MAWNRPSNDGRANTPGSPRRGHRPRPTVRGAIAGAIVVVGAAVAAWLLWSEGETRQDAASAKKGLIKEVTPAVPTNAVKKTGRQWPPEWHVPDDWDKPYPPQAYWPDGTLKQNSRYVKVITNKTRVADMPIHQRVFRNSAERRIASLMLMKPGTRLVGDRKYDEMFVDAFKESLKHEIVIEEGDSEYVRRLKETVRDVKAELKARMDAGEDIAKVMTDTRKELKELGLYREELRKQVNKIQAEHEGEFTPKEQKELIDAANLMLKERGCEPLKMPKMLIKQLEMEK